MKSIRVGIVGYGWFGRLHAETWRTIPNVELVAVCDENPNAFSVSQHAQDTFHVAAVDKSSVNAADKTFTDVGRMIAEMDLDLLDVVVPEAGHCDVAGVGLEAGIDVFVEKPFVTSSVQSTHLRLRAQQYRKHIHVGHILRFDPRYEALAMEVHGRHVLSMSLSRHFQRAAHSVYGRTHPFFSACIHDIDVALWMKGHRPVNATALTRHFLGKESPDSVVGILEWDDGTTAVLQNSWHLSQSCPHGFAFDTLLIAEGATLRVQSTASLEAWSDDEGAKAPELFFWPGTRGDRGGALRAELSYVASCVAEGMPSDRVPLDDVHAAICIAEALVHSEKAKSSVAISYD